MQKISLFSHPIGSKESRFVHFVAISQTFTITMSYTLKRFGAQWFSGKNPQEQMMQHRPQ